VTTGLKKENRKKQQNIKDRNNEENMIKMHVHFYMGDDCKQNETREYRKCQGKC
jgi:hypothetical protein